MKKNCTVLPAGPVPRQMREEGSLLKPGQPLSDVLQHYDRTIRRFKRTWYVAGGCLLLVLMTILVLLFSH